MLVNGQEEVEIVGKAVAEREKLVSVVAEVKNKRSGELIALGRQWLTTNPLLPHPTYDVHYLFIYLSFYTPSLLFFF